MDARRLSAASREAIAAPGGPTLRQAFELYRELNALGYGDEFEARQKSCARRGASWVRSSAAGVACAMEIWVDLLGDRPVAAISDHEVDEALNQLWQLPATHGKGRWVARDGYRDLIERADAHEKEAARAAVVGLRRKGKPTEAEIEAAEIRTRVKRLRVETYLKHGCMANRIGRMLHAMRLIAFNPFEICSWTKRQEAQLREHEEGRARRTWDDRLHELFATPVFQGELDEPGAPLFWAPLIARHQGLRMEECLQLAPDDSGVEKGIAYMDVRNVDGNLVKSASSERRLPVHPNLVEMGLLKLVEMRRRQGQPRLFPHLGRGATKGTLTELFTKAFGYYRRTNDVYWHGLDFHALRTSFHVDLLNDDGSDALRRRLMGHTPLDEAERSDAQGLCITKLHDRIRKVRVDVSMIRSPFAEGGATSAHSRAAALGLRIA